MQLLKKIAASLPQRWQMELKRIHFRRQIKKGTFITNEPEYKILYNFVKPGDWVIDIGANVGHYTKRLSDLVGVDGRVIAFEPVPITFSLLSANVQMFSYANVSLINAAVSDKLGIVGMSMPVFSTGLKNYYEAHVSYDEHRELSVLSLSIDSLHINKPVSLVKIDAEGHESFVLAGMMELIEAFHPILVIEAQSNEVASKLYSMGYTSQKLKNSPNILFKSKHK